MGSLDVLVEFMGVKAAAEIGFDGKFSDFESRSDVTADVVQDVGAVCHQISRLPRARCVTSKGGFGLIKPDSRLGGWFEVVDRRRQVRLST